MKKKMALYTLVGGMMSLLVTSCAQQKNDKYNQEEKKQGCGCSSENILDLRASEHSSESLANPTAKL